MLANVARVFMTVFENVQKIKKILQDSENPHVKLVAVSKYSTVDQVIEAYEAGLRIFGENYVLPALEKKKQLEAKFSEKVEWHLIGHLQKNKVKKAVGNFDLIHSVDSADLAKAISDEAAKQGIDQDILIQVNVSGEETKSGFDIEEFKSVYQDLQALKNINIQGLMTMGPKNPKSSQELETIFASMRHLKSETVSNCSELSMGMTNDFELAIRQGSTIIRLGRAIFGEKKED